MPVFNEEKNIREVINGLFAHIDLVIAVDDCSTDNSRLVLESINNEKLIIIHNEKNLGIGGATKVGINKALSLNADYIVKFDGDGQHLAEDIPKFLTMLEEDNADFVKGNRFKSSVTDMPITKLIGNLISTNLQKIVTGNFRISDPNNGFIAFKSKIFDRIQLKYLRNDYFFENSFLLNLVVHRYKITELPIDTIYGNEKSSIPILRGSIKIIPTFVKLLYLKNFLNTKYNLSMGSLIFFFINILTTIKIFNSELIEVKYIIYLIIIYSIIEIINFLTTYE